MKKKPFVAPENMAIDEHGRPLPLNPEQVRDNVNRMMKSGRIMAVIFQAKNGEIGVQVFGPPSEELADALDAAARGYRVALKGHA